MVARLTGRTSTGFGSTAVAVVAFGVAMGYLEAAVVVYLRAALGLAPAELVTSRDPSTFGALAGIEIARELATLIMIGAVGWLAGRRPLERLAWAAVAFGAWDIAYYVGLRLAIGWPPSFDTWDVLFLVPIPWVGPVWAPIGVSSALVLIGLPAARRLRGGGPVVVRTIQATAALVGGGLVIVSFMVDTSRVMAGDPGAWTGWPLYWTGMGLAAAAAATALRWFGRTSPASQPAEIMEPGADRRSAPRTDQGSA